MSAIAKILVFAGSTRRDSFNKKLAHLAAQGARDAGAEVTLVDLRDMPMPLYDGDLEAERGVPPHGRALRELMMSHRGIVIAAPEYNGGISGVLKNALDWVSRRDGEVPPQVAYHGKVALLLSTSTGALGGIRGLGQVQQVLQHRGVLVLPHTLSVPKAAEAFDAAGALVDAHHAKRIAELTAQLVATVTALAGA